MPIFDHDENYSNETNKPTDKEVFFKNIKSSQEIFQFINLLW